MDMALTLHKRWDHEKIEKKRLTRPAMDMALTLHKGCGHESMDKKR
jgi:hypothetical protein